MDPISLLAGIGAAIAAVILPAYSCEKALEFHQENTPKLERQIAELEREKIEHVSTVARLEHDLRVLQGVREENMQLRQENKGLRERLEAALLEHHALVVGQSKISKDTQADMEDLRQWAERELKRRRDQVDDLHAARWHDKAEYGRKLAEYQRLLRQARAEAGGLRTKLTAKEADLATAREELRLTRSKLATAVQDLANMRQAMQNALADKDIKHQAEIRRYRIAVTGLGAVFFITLVVLVFVLLRRRKNS